MGIAKHLLRMTDNTMEGQAEMMDDAPTENNIEDQATLEVTVDLSLCTCMGRSSFLDCIVDL